MSQCLDGPAREPEAHLLDNYRDGHGRGDGGDRLAPTGEVAVALGHDHLLGRIEVDLQGVGLKHLHGPHRLLGADRRADVGQNEGTRSPTTDDTEAVDPLGIVQGDVLGAAGDRNTGIGGHLG